MRPPRLPRALRGAAAGSVATTGALLSHLAGGGAMPGLGGVAISLALSLVVCTLLAGQRLSLLRLTAAVAISQSLFHSLFVLAARPAPTLVLPASATDGSHLHGGVPMSDAAMPAATITTSAPMSDVSAPLHDMSAMAGSSAGMWFWHAFAAVVTIAIVHRGERTLLELQALGRAIASRARRTIVFPESVPVAIPDGLTRLPVCAAPASAADEPFLVSVGRRGPPGRLISVL
ncbi:hypothetical protein [Millisia brevis]|uniref:hypothetical protein n=1 Tax=Millisia brevis TaxID=264148 RepID=UPI000834D78D|nr:hypothetical protein [Millisia brevis]